MRKNKYVKRKIQIAVISDVHLGTYGCRAEELHNYLRSIEPDILILNGDIIDIWQFSKNYWPKSHMKVVNRLLKMISNGTRVYYITGNHDELLRKFTDFQLASFTLCNKLVVEINGQKTWFFHGDVFDMSINYSKWLAKLGGKGYDLLILINSFLNNALEYFGYERVSLSKKVKNSVKRAVKFVNDFEKTAIDMAGFHGYDVVVCGHIHQPAMRKVQTEHGEVMYLNSGDWVENLTALELNNGTWSVFSYRDSALHEHPLERESAEEDPEEDIAKEFEPVLQMMRSIA